MKRISLILFVVLVLVVGGWYAYRSGWVSRVPGLSPADVGGGSQAPESGNGTSSRGVVAMGRIEPAGGIVDIAGLTGDRLATILVNEGDSISKDQVLARLESHSLRKLELEAAQSQVEDAEARLRAEEKLAASRILAAELAVQKATTVDLDIEAQQAKVELAQSNLHLAEKDLERLVNLRGQRSRLVSDQELDRQRTVVDQAQAGLVSGQALLKKLNRTRQLHVQVAEADLDAARASRDQMVAAIPVRSLEKQCQLAREQFEQTEIRAPIDGRVLEILVRPGETLTGAPALQVADLSKMVVVAEVYETEAKRIERGQPVVIESHALKSPYDEKGLRGTVLRIAGMITTPELRSLNPLAMADRRVVEVIIDLDEESIRQASRLCNLQVDVTVQPGRD